MISSLDLKTLYHWTDWPKKHFLRLCLVAVALFVLIAPNRSAHYSYLLLIGAFWNVGSDRLALPWQRFLSLGIPLVLFPILMWQYFPPIWNDVVYWQLGTRTHLLDLDALFKSIPGNDGRLFRIIQTPWLTGYFRWIYANGFTLPVLIPIFRSFWAKDSLKMIRYSLSAHILQFLLIFPFYLTIHVNEVWYVLGQPDGMARNLSAADAAVVVVNCFPSMHTSIAFAMLLLAWREKDKLFRYVWTFFCLSVIYSTLYLEIHWVTDVLAGIVLALAAVKLGDWLIRIVSGKWRAKFGTAKVCKV
ncbi:phosphatase PAP2 family protein [Desulfosporosinus sp. PR]|uniref:phosphatase PAP2 family protein n=1 Tax=Candidatus Desulfosporosinus nitrosoreducens TaxID=3401928 RepID=UPI0027EF2A3C|nr:phosphatase PAP2 family protein [Desulfosporosinus sp. PR]MDQ7096431.1 phosphatase PAP2 family protein [Desulfosporosinus sp. PR]